MTQNQKLDVIKALNLAKYKVLEIYDHHNRIDTLRFFAINEFISPQNHIKEIMVRGRDITTVIQENSLAVQSIGLRNRDEVLLTKIESIENEVINFSEDFTYIYYISTQDLRQF